MIELLPVLQRHFDKLQEHLVCFCETGVQVEGWFKGELLTLLSSLRGQELIRDFDREVEIPCGNVDLTVRTESDLHWIELKHWLIGKQKGITYGPNFYFGDRTSIGAVKDVDKLVSIVSPGRLWLLILLTANPGKDPWLAAVDKFNSKFSPRCLTSQSRPEDFPGTYFLGLLEVCKGGVHDSGRH